MADELTLPRSKLVFVVDWASGERRIIDSIREARLVLGMRIVRDSRMSRRRRVVAAASVLYRFALVSHRMGRRGQLIVCLRERVIDPVEPDALAESCAIGNAVRESHLSARPEQAFPK